MRSWDATCLWTSNQRKLKINNIYNLQSKLLVYNKQKPVRSIWGHELCKCCWICLLYLRIRFLKGKKNKKCYMIDLRKKPNSSGGVKIIWIHVFQATWSFSPLLKCILFLHLLFSIHFHYLLNNEIDITTKIGLRIRIERNKRPSITEVLIEAGLFRPS